MTLNEYQELAKKTASYSNFVPPYIYLALGLPGEAGEVAEKVKKIVRNKNGVIGEEDKTEIIKELGDVLWYLSQFATQFDIPFEEVAKANLAKLSDRQERNVIKSKGDNR